MTSSRHSGRHQRFAVALATAACMALVAPATVPAATTVGQTAPTPGDVFNCGVASLFVQGTVAAPPDYVIPTGGGIITSWSVMGLSGGELKLKIVRRTAPNTYTIVAEDIQRPTAEGLNTFNTRIPVTGGELLALWVPSSGSPCSISNTNPGDALEFRMPSSPEPGIGQPFQTNSSSSGSRLNVSASLEADCDSDGFGDETQDTNLASCAPGTTPTGPITGPGGAPVTCRGLNATIVGTNGNDARIGSLGRDVIAGLGGNDTLSGIRGDDVVCGGAGRDLLKGGKGKDSLLGQKGKDALKGGPGRDLCKGGKGTDTASKCEVEKSI